MRFHQGAVDRTPGVGDRDLVHRVHLDTGRARANLHRMLEQRSLCRKDTEPKCLTVRHRCSEQATREQEGCSDCRHGVSLHADTCAGNPEIADPASLVRLRVEPARHVPDRRHHSGSVQQAVSWMDKHLLLAPQWDSGVETCVSTRADARTTCSADYGLRQTETKALGGSVAVDEYEATPRGGFTAAVCT